MLCVLLAVLDSLSIKEFISVLVVETVIRLLLVSGLFFRIHFVLSSFWIFFDWIQVIHFLISALVAVFLECRDIWERIIVLGNYSRWCWVLSCWTLFDQVKDILLSIINSIILLVVYVPTVHDSIIMFVFTNGWGTWVTFKLFKVYCSGDDCWIMPSLVRVIVMGGACFGLIILLRWNIDLWIRAWLSLPIMIILVCRSCCQRCVNVILLLVGSSFISSVSQRNRLLVHILLLPKLFVVALLAIIDFKDLLVIIDGLVLQGI